MKKDYIFFAADGNSGLTSTSANHIANMAKEMIRGLEASLDSLVLYSTAVALIGTDSADTLSIGAKETDLVAVEGKLLTVAKAKSLIAWLREAIKAKERLIAEAEAMTAEEYARSQGIELPKEPEQKPALTEDDYYASLTLAERNRYYELETLAAVLGKAIHPDGSFANAREALDQRVQHPREVKGDGRDTLIYSYTPTVKPEAVEEVYFVLQRQYREVQSRLNAMKFDCQRAVRTSQVEVQTAYAEAVARYNEERKLLDARLSAYVRQRTRELGDMKIRIPESLREIYSEVSGLGK